MPKVRQILCTIANNDIIEDKNMFIQLLYWEFRIDQNNVIIEKKSNAELFTLS